MANRVDFDDFSHNYREALNASIPFFREQDDYFDLYKINCLKKWVLGEYQYSTMLDFGCGIGKQTYLIARMFPELVVDGFDISSKSIQTARENCSDVGNLHFFDRLPEGKHYDIITAVNVFHHIPPAEREDILHNLRYILEPNGRLVIFEHNPLNPLTRYAVKICPFDADAKLIWPSRFIKLARQIGMKVIRRQYIVFFPGFEILNKLEFRFGRVPFGAQYMLILRSR